MGYIYNDVEKLKNNLDNILGEEIIISETLTKRGRRINKLATVDKTYDTFFRVSFENQQRTNYNYSDVLTREIEIKTFDGEHFVPLFVPRPLTKKETIPTLNMDDHKTNITSEDLDKF